MTHTRVQLSPGDEIEVAGFVFVLDKMEVVSNRPAKVTFIPLSDSETKEK